MKYKLYAIIAAASYAISIPLSKILLKEIPSTTLAGILYFGAGIGMLLITLSKGYIKKDNRNNLLVKSDLPYVIGMVALDILAPILLMLAINKSSTSVVSLLNNFEIVATTFIALIFFKEKVSGKLWIGIIFVTAASVILSIDLDNKLTFSVGALLTLLACTCWGVENNFTRKISDKNTYQIVIIKGLFSGIGSIIIGLIFSETITNWLYVGFALILGFVSYGLSVFFYVLAQSKLGASKTSAYYALSPFIGVILSFILFMSIPNYLFFIALPIMIIGTIFISKDKLVKEKN